MAVHGNLLLLRSTYCVLSQPRTLNWPSPLNHSDQHNYDRQHQQKVNKSAERVRAHHSQEPQNHQDYRNRPKQVHFSLLSCLFLEPARCSWVRTSRNYPLPDKRLGALPPRSDCDSLVACVNTRREPNAQRNPRPSTEPSGKRRRARSHLLVVVRSSQTAANLQGPAVWRGVTPRLHFPAVPLNHPVAFTRDPF